MRAIAGLPIASGLSDETIRKRVAENSGEMPINEGAYALFPYKLKTDSPVTRLFFEDGKREVQDVAFGGVMEEWVVDVLVEDQKYQVLVLPSANGNERMVSLLGRKPGVDTFETQDYHPNVNEIATFDASYLRSLPIARGLKAGRAYLQAGLREPARHDRKLGIHRIGVNAVRDRVYQVAMGAGSRVIATYDSLFKTNPLAAEGTVGDFVEGWDLGTMYLGRYIMNREAGIDPDDLNGVRGTSGRDAAGHLRKIFDYADEPLSADEALEEVEANYQQYLVMKARGEALIAQISAGQ